MNLIVRHLLCLVIFVFALSSNAKADGVGRIKVLTGEVQIERSGQMLAAEVGSVVFQSDRIVSGGNSSFGITFNDNSMISGGANTSLSLDQYRFDTTTHDGNFDVSLKTGTLSVIAGKITQRNPNAMKIKTPASILAVRGTELVVKVDED